MGGKSRNNKLCDHEELPDWCKDNAFIVSGYRRPGESGEVGGPTQDDKVVEAPLRRERTGESEVVNRKRQAKPVVQEPHEVKVFRHDSVRKCWDSIWSYVHNESVNIHTHLWGATTSVTILGLHILHHFEALPRVLRPLTHASIFMPPTGAKQAFAALAAKNPTASVLSLSLPTASTIYDSIEHSPNEWRDTVGFAIFLLAAITCLTFSTSFHTLACHSHALAKRFNALDYVGIVVMIVGSFLPALHYGFYCFPYLQAMYATAIAILGSLATWTVVSPRYATPEFRPYRTAIFLALGLSAVVPVAHGYLIYGYSVLRLTMGLDYLVLSGSLYVVGALLYACRVPERFAPGTFDLFGASHQIFHFAILLAAFSHYICLRRSYTFWHALQADGGAEPLTRHAVCQLLL
ncbi:unnamed protein product [Parajaminaea phylloscopi]